VTWVSWFDAIAFAEWIWAALPTGAQWEFAARGPQGWTYPWGDSPPTCALANLERCTSGTSPVGAYPAGASWVGALDLAGNAWEWVADYYARDYYATLTDGVLDPLGPPFGDMHNVRGSSWEDEARYARAYYQGGNYPDYVTYVLGFRIAVPAGAGEVQLPTLPPAGRPTLSVALSASPTGDSAPIAARIKGSEPVNVRSGPGTNYPIVLTANQSSSLDLLSLRNDWVYARVDDSYGWIRQDLLDYSGDLRSLPAPEAAGVSICDLPGSHTASDWARVHWRIGCPVGKEQFMLGTSQAFANGVMVYRSEPSRMIYVILDDGRWAVYDDDWYPGTPLTCSGQYIGRGFGEVYCDHAGVAQVLGPATTAERPGSTMFIQEFESGIIFGIEQVGTRILDADDATDF